MRAKRSEVMKRLYEFAWSPASQGVRKIDSKDVDDLAQIFGAELESDLPPRIWYLPRGDGRYELSAEVAGDKVVIGILSMADSRATADNFAGALCCGYNDLLIRRPEWPNAASEAAP